MKILVVDDIEENLYLLETLLKGNGHEVVSAKDGVEALNKLKEESIDLIISDILMPRMDGFQFCRECKKDDRLKKIPFIFYTATYTEKKDEEFALSLSAEKFIVKPQEPETFLKILNEVIEEHKKGARVTSKEPIKEEKTYLSEYNERLIRKLEKKVLDLEKANKILQEKEEKIYSLNQFQENIINSANIWIDVLDEKANVIIWNKAAEKISGYSSTEVIGHHKIWEWLYPEKKYRKKIFSKAGDIIKKAGEMEDYETRICCKNGKVKIISWNSSNLTNSRGKIIGSIGLGRDITERKEAEERIKHLDLVIHAVRNINQLIVKEKDRERLLKGACDSLTKTRGYHNSWIVLMNEEGKIDTYAETGLGEVFLSMVELLKEGKLTVYSQKALKQKDIVIIENPASTCVECPLVQECSNRGGTMTIRLEHSGKVYGLMSVSTSVHFITDKEEQALFKEVAGDIALGLHSIKLGKKLDKQTLDLKERVQELKRAMDATIETMSKIIEAKDPYTAGHQQRVSQLAIAIAKEIDLSQDKVEGIRIASLIHDIGKIAIPTELLSKPVRLTDLEFSLVKSHSQMGFDILKSIDFSYPVAQIVLQHHERLNGSGYPRGLKGNEILLEAKIIGVADVVEAISSHRPYRPALGIDKALEEISKNKGILYDPEVVDICIKLFQEKEFKF